MGATCECVWGGGILEERSVGGICVFCGVEIVAGVCMLGCMWGCMLGCIEINVSDHEGEGHDGYTCYCEGDGGDKEERCEA